jgi:hypothetical protein
VLGLFFVNGIGIVCGVTAHHKRPGRNFHKARQRVMRQVPAILRVKTWVTQAGKRIAGAERWRSVSAACRSSDCCWRTSGLGFSSSSRAEPASSSPARHASLLPGWVESHSR